MRLRFLLARDAAALSDALNLFVRALFEELPGLDAATVERIVEYRRAHGRLDAFADLLAANAPGGVLGHQQSAVASTSDPR